MLSASSRLQRVLPQLPRASLWQLHRDDRPGLQGGVEADESQEQELGRGNRGQDRGNVAEEETVII